jgi:AraC family transcriptional regulator, transcriptional activator FtrA
MRQYPVMTRVAIVVFRGASSFELAIPVEVFGHELLAGRCEVTTVAGERGPLRTRSGWRVPTQAGLEALAEADTILVPGWRDPGDPPDAPLRSALAAAYERGARIVSLCIGAFALARAGLLDGRAATTHWQFAERLAREHPRVTVRAGALYVEDGPVLTSAGVAAGIDLCLHIVRTDHGSAVANALARRLVVAPHRQGQQAQYVELPVPDLAGPGMGEVLEWIEGHLEQPLTIAQLARRSHLSVRQFTRRFVAATGVSPHAWITSRRVEAARGLLETSDLPVDAVARECGFGSPALLRLHFRRAVGNTPTGYRATFR